MRDDAETVRLKLAGDMIARQQERRLAKRPYVKLPHGHPDYDAEDLPHWWQRAAAESAGVAVTVAILVAVIVLSRPLGPMLPDALDSLSRLVR